MLKINTLSRFTLFSSLMSLLFLIVGGTLAAQTLNQGYSSDEPLQKGMLVTEKDDDPTKVVALKQEDLDKLKGVVVQQNDAPATISSEGQNIFVATTGKFEVLISDENGPVAPGDYISISSLDGIGMKARNDQKIVVGRAVSEFNGEKNNIGSAELSGRRINFGRVPVVIEIGRNPFFNLPSGTSIPKLMERISVTVAGKPVSATKIWLAAAVFLGSLFITGVMLYSGARSSLLSVGRNPLSKTAILKGLVQIVVMSLIVFIAGMFGVYLLLKL
ncbi:hypothetical protein KY385_04100 [Candidatus Parcubacteria bacterium]|nr:hypothetical protein [Candidatus Parcubacteria bacterium]